MTRETKICQNCKSEFIIEPEDFLFYEKMQVPAPTFCPECRLQRRLAWRNERTLYKRICDLCKKSIISMYFEGVPFPVYCSSCWWSDKWDPREFGMEYKNNESFFEQFFELMKKVPHQSLQLKRSVNSDYANYTMNSKNVYLSSIIFASEDISFSRFLLESKNCVGCSYSTKIENCINLSRTAFCSDCSDSMILDYCQNVHFSYDSTNCNDCYGCVNLHHKKYHIFNQPYSKKEYEEKIKELRSLPLNTQRSRVNEFLKTQPQRGYIYYFSNNVSGEEVYNSDNCKECYLANFVRDSAFVFNTSSLARSNEATHDIYDCSVVADMASSYEMIGGSKSYQCRFGIINDNSFSAEYSMFCYGSNDLFGCIGMRNKKYCILNKEYDKATFDRLRKGIIAKTQSYGEFFPIAFSPFAYNETLAQEFFPLTKEAARKKGYAWKDSKIKDYQITLLAKNVPDTIQKVADSILEETIGCAHEGKCNEQCASVFKVISQELELYRKLGYPLPRLCPNCRYYQMLNEKNPLRLFDARCGCGGETSSNGVYGNKVAHIHGKDSCPNSFKTIFDPKSGMIAYCIPCYRSEIA